MSPGYETESLLDFSRPIDSNCLFCHAGSIAAADREVKLTPISCERCHGPSEQHLRRPVPGSIVNPAKLPVRARDSVCEQCHLEGAATILNPGKVWSDFRAGEELEAVETSFVYNSPDRVRAVSQAEQLAGSACVGKSGGKLWCGSCHDPHGEPTKFQAHTNQVCRTCHSVGSLNSEHPQQNDHCISCHMPRTSASDVLHAAITDHRIQLPGRDTTHSVAPPVLVAWHPAQSGLADRALGLALFHEAREGAPSSFQKSFDILSKLPAYKQDAEVCAALGYMLLAQSKSSEAIRYFTRSTELNPHSAEYWLDLGVAQQAANRNELAVRSFEKGIALDPFDSRPYQALAALRRAEHDPVQANAALDRYLKVVPQSILIRLLRH